MTAERGRRHEQEEKHAFSDRYNSSLFVSIGFTLNWRRVVNTWPLANMCVHTCTVFTWSMLVDAPLQTACIVRKVSINCVWKDFWKTDIYYRKSPRKIHRHRVSNETWLIKGNMKYSNWSSKIYWKLETTTIQVFK